MGKDECQHMQQPWFFLPDDKCLYYNDPSDSIFDGILNPIFKEGGQYEVIATEEIEKLFDEIYSIQM